MISATTRVAAVIGWPVRHSLSPVLYNTAFAALGCDWTYVAFPVPPDQGAAAVSAMRSLGLAGMSVTMPHKEVVAAAVDERTPVAEALRAVNCVSWADDGRRLVGDNTDAAGLVDALRLDGDFEPAGRSCVVLGAGGAGRAAVWGLAQAGAGEVVVVNRSPARARQAAALAGAAGRVGTPDDAAKADLVVNATPLGMSGGDGAAGGVMSGGDGAAGGVMSGGDGAAGGVMSGGDGAAGSVMSGGDGAAGSVMSGGDGAAGGVALPLDPTLLHADQLVVDLIYHPATTPFMAAAAERGARVVGGLPMLVHQAAHQIRRWIGAEPPVAHMTAAARDAFEKKKPQKPAS